MTKERALAVLRMLELASDDTARRVNNERSLIRMALQYGKSARITPAECREVLDSKVSSNLLRKADVQ